MMIEEESPPKTTPQKFLVVGLITSEDFQKCKYALTKLNASFPKEFDTPNIRPVLDVEWNEFIKKHQRLLGNGLWSIKNNVAVFKDGEFLGDFDDLFEFIWRKRRFAFNQDWHDLASKHLMEYLEEKTDHYRQLVYLTVAINNQVVGSLLFQCGGYDLGPHKMPCENYVVPHDRRGVLSMCNNGPHRDNSTQFYVTLECAPWMNYKYVAFGQLLQGDDVLQTITDVPTYYQAPTCDITIVKCGEFKTRFQADSSNVLFQADEIDKWKGNQDQIDILSYLKTCHAVIGPEGEDLNHTCEFPAVIASCDSVLFRSKMKTGLYSLRSDLKTYDPFSHLPDFGSDGDEGAEDYDICEPAFSLMRYRNKLYNDDLLPNSSDITL